MSRLFTRSSILVLVIIAMLAVAAGYSISQVPDRQVYQATARFQVRRDQSPDHPQKVDLLGEMYKRIKQMRLYNLKGGPAISQLVNDLNLTQYMPRTADGELTTEGVARLAGLVQSISAAISIQAEVDEAFVELIAVTVRHEDAELAVKIANQLVENYIRRLRTEMDDVLLDSKKFFDTESQRYRRKLSDLEAARLRFNLNLPPGVDLSDPVATHHALDVNRIRQDHEDAKRKLNLLRELSKDKATGDGVVLALFQLELDVEKTKRALEHATENKDQYEGILRNFFQLRSEHLKLDHEFKETSASHAYWNDKLREVQTALMLSVGERGLRASFVERAGRATLVKPNQR